MSDRQPVRIAFCMTDLDPGGAERALVRLVTGLDRSRWEPHVFCLAPPGILAKDLQQAAIPVTCFGAQRKGNLFVIFRLARELRRFRPALLQTFLYHANIAGRIAGKLARVPVIVSGIRVAERRSRFRLWLDRITRGLVDHHVCVSSAVAEFSRRHSRLPQEKITVIPNGVAAETFSNAQPADLTRFGISTHSRTLLFVGRLDPQKDPALLLEVLEQLAATQPQLHLLYVGEGPLRGDLEQRVAQSGLTERVHFAGRRNDVPSLMKSCNLLALPSRWEGMPNVVLEAMAAGLPVVATDVEGIHELLDPGMTGLIVPVGSLAAFCEAVQSLLDNPGAAQEIARRSQETVLKGFTWEEMVSRYDALYSELTGFLTAAK